MGCSCSIAPSAEIESFARYEIRPIKFKAKLARERGTHEQVRPSTLTQPASEVSHSTIEASE